VDFEAAHRRIISKRERRKLANRRTPLSGRLVSCDAHPDDLIALRDSRRITMSLTSPRFAGDPVLEGCAANTHVMEPPESGLAVRRVQWALLDLQFSLPQFGADGSFGAETASAVSAFKRSRGIEPSDGKVGPKTIRQLDVEMLPSMDDLQLHYSDRRSFYSNRALARARDSHHPGWLPELGWLANRARVVDLYGYYRDLSLIAPNAFLWAGLARMAGGAVVGGLDLDSAVSEQIVFVRIGRDIFYDLAWLHEAYLDHPSEAIKLGHLHDRFNEYTLYPSGVPTFMQGFPVRSYGAAWGKITTGDVAAGNLDLLENEQKSIIPPHYDFLRTFTTSGLATPFTNEIHPYHRAFIVEVPTGDIFDTADRWSWITRVNGMYQRWGDIGAAERTRLVNLSMGDLANGRFGAPGRPDLLPPGGP
jgi:Putative peptidoglycan binding domain